MIKAKYILFVLMIGLLLSCGDDDDMGSGDSPSAVSLIFPEDNTECNEGVIISQTTSEVLFKWSNSENTDSYVLKITNLESNTVRNLNASSNELAVGLLRGAPYSWSVISKSDNNSKTAESKTWKFYNAGLPDENHPPFPAEAVSPKSGSSIEAGEITLEWQAQDLDDDIQSYAVLLSTNNPPTTEVGSTNTNSLNVTVSSGQVYYWKVISADEAGNTSDSQVFQFKVN